MGTRLPRWLWISAIAVAAATVAYGWRSGTLRDWSSYVRMALFRSSLIGAVNGDGARWTVERSGVIGKRVWLFDLRSEVRPNADGVADVYLAFLPSPDAAGRQFGRSGNQFVEPVLVAYVKGTQPPPVPFAPPIISHTSLPGLADGNFVWNGYGSNTRGVIKFRQGRVIGEINAPSLADAEQLGRAVAGLLLDRGY